MAIMLAGCNDEPEINLLCKKENKEGKFEEVYLVKNYPKQENDLHELVDLFNQDLKVIENIDTRTFIKEHDNRASDFALGDHLDYEKNKCKEIDNMDILCQVSKVNFHNGGDTIIFNYFK
jgi:hypothetical protein